MCNTNVQYISLSSVIKSSINSVAINCYTLKSLAIKFSIKRVKQNELTAYTTLPIFSTVNLPQHFFSKGRQGRAAPRQQWEELPEEDWTNSTRHSREVLPYTHTVPHLTNLQTTNAGRRSKSRARRKDVGSSSRTRRKDSSSSSSGRTRERRKDSSSSGNSLARVSHLRSRKKSRRKKRETSAKPGHNTDEPSQQQSRQTGSQSLVIDSVQVSRCFWFMQH